MIRGGDIQAYSMAVYMSVYRTIFIYAVMPISITNTSLGVAANKDFH